MKHTIRNIKDEVLYLSNNTYRFVKEGTATEPVLCFTTEDGYFVTTHDRTFDKNATVALTENDTEVGTVHGLLTYGMFGKYEREADGGKLPILPRRDIEPYMATTLLSATEDGTVTQPVRLIGEHDRRIFTAMPPMENGVVAWKHRPQIGDAILAHGAIAAFVVQVVNDHCFCLEAEQMMKDLRRAIRKEGCKK